MLSLDIPKTETIETVYESMVTSRYGFAVTNLGISEEELNYLNDFSISRSICFNCLGQKHQFENILTECLEKLGTNHPRIIEEVKNIIVKITEKALQATNSQYAWFHIKTEIPPDSTYLKRWHIDNLLMPTAPIQYKFCVTLKGASTRFYLLDIDKTHLRKIIFRNVNDVYFTNEFCREDFIFSPSHQEGVFFIMANPSTGAFHAPPQVFEPRLFFSIVPAKKEQLEEIQRKIMRSSPPSEHEIYFIF